MKAGEGRGQGASLAVQWLRLHPPSAGPRFHPWPGNWIPCAATKTQCGQIHKFFFFFLRVAVGVWPQPVTALGESVIPVLTFCLCFLRTL